MVRGFPAKPIPAETCMPSNSLDVPKRLSGERFEFLVQAVTDYAIYMIEPDGTIATWNSGAARLKGYSQDEVIGQHFSRFFTPEDQAEAVFYLASDRSSKVTGQVIPVDGGLQDAFVR